MSALAVTQRPKPRIIFNELGRGWRTGFIDDFAK
jgi:hypothetical protein